MTKAAKIYQKYFLENNTDKRVLLKETPAHAIVIAFMFGVPESAAMLALQMVAWHVVMDTADNIVGAVTAGDKTVDVHRGPDARYRRIVDILNQMVPDGPGELSKKDLTAIKHSVGFDITSHPAVRWSEDYEKWYLDEAGAKFVILRQTAIVEYSEKIGEFLNIIDLFNSRYPKGFKSVARSGIPLPDSERRLKGKTAVKIVKREYPWLYFIEENTRLKRKLEDQHVLDMERYEQELENYKNFNSIDATSLEDLEDMDGRFDSGPDGIDRNPPEKPYIDRNAYAARWATSTNFPWRRGQAGLESAMHYDELLKSDEDYLSFWNYQEMAKRLGQPVEIDDVELSFDDEDLYDEAEREDDFLNLNLDQKTKNALKQVAKKPKVKKTIKKKKKTTEAEMNDIKDFLENVGKKSGKKAQEKLKQAIKSEVEKKTREISNNPEALTSALNSNIMKPGTAKKVMSIFNLSGEPDLQVRSQKIASINKQLGIEPSTPEGVLAAISKKSLKESLLKEQSKSTTAKGYNSQLKYFQNNLMSKIDKSLTQIQDLLEVYFGKKSATFNENDRRYGPETYTAIVNFQTDMVKKGFLQKEKRAGQSSIDGLYGPLTNAAFKAAQAIGALLGHKEPTNIEKIKARITQLQNFIKGNKNQLQKNWAASVIAELKKKLPTNGEAKAPTSDQKQILKLGQDKVRQKYIDGEISRGGAMTWMRWHRIMTMAGCINLIPNKQQMTIAKDPEGYCVDLDRRLAGLKKGVKAAKGDGSKEETPQPPVEETNRFKVISKYNFKPVGKAYHTNRTYMVAYYKSEDGTGFFLPISLPSDSREIELRDDRGTISGRNLPVYNKEGRGIGWAKPAKVRNRKTRSITTGYRIFPMALGRFQREKLPKTILIVPEKGARYAVGMENSPKKSSFPEEILTATDLKPQPRDYREEPQPLSEQVFNKYFTENKEILNFIQEEEFSIERAIEIFSFVTV